MSDREAPVQDNREASDQNNTESPDQEALRARQMAEAEELLGDRWSRLGFAKGLYFGQYRAERLLPYPDLRSEPAVNELVDKVSEFCRESIDPAAIDREAEIPASVVDGLGRLGVLGACLPEKVGGLGLSQTSYCRILEVLGGHCGGTALFVNAHHSIGPRALVLFGTPEQQERWLPPLARGQSISAFALTEPEAGSDAANVQTTATPAPDGSGYVVNGEKRWITNGGIADILTVMARTPVPGSTETKVTAFLVTPDLAGFEVVEERMPKMGVRGTVTSRLRFRDMTVPRENVLGPLGKGLRVALTVLDFGRITFGASCTGAARFCCRRAVAHARARTQFGRRLADFELVKQKLARMHASTYAMEAMTYMTAALIDSGSDDYMLETAMLKVFATDMLWEILNDTFQIHGGMAYFSDQPFERMIRDARINTIGEGSNDVLRAFIALVGMRDVGLELESVATAARRPLRHAGPLGRFVGKRLERLFASPEVPVHTSELQADAVRLGQHIRQFGIAVERSLARHREAILDRQYQQARIANAATELYASGCVLARLDRLASDPRTDKPRQRIELAAGRHYLLTAGRRIRARLADLTDNDDQEVTRFADRVLAARDTES